MNKHLEQVFNILLIGLEKAGIDYWVFAGVAIAGVKGEFFRKNGDVDIFVKATDFKKSTSILKKLSDKQGNLLFYERGVLIREDYKRPIWKATNIKTNNKIFSIVPAFLEGNIIKLVFGNGVKTCGNTILEKVERKISGYRFFTPPHKDIKDIFLYCFRHRKNWKTREDIRKDAKMILGSDEFEKYFPIK